MRAWQLDSVHVAARTCKLCIAAGRPGKGRGAGSGARASLLSVRPGAAALQPALLLRPLKRLLEQMPVEATLRCNWCRALQQAWLFSQALAL